MWKEMGFGLVVALALTGCPISDSASGGGESPGGGPNGGSDAGGDAATGKECTIPTSSGLMLCEEISLCPTLTVNQNSFNGCGFNVSGNIIDLECECSGYLCKASPTPTCAATATILSTESFTEVCLQLSTGGCVFEGLSGGSGSGTGSATGCNTTCASQCLGDPRCTSACGC